jgi:drug/metabolite transporter (DMT)-like permease
VVVVLALALLAAAVLLVRSHSALPWPAIGIAALTSGVCFTVGGGSVKASSAPDIATVVGAVAGFLAVVSATMALVPLHRDPDRPASRTPIHLCVGGIALGAIGLLLNLLVG